MSRGEWLNTEPVSRTLSDALDRSVSKAVEGAYRAEVGGLPSSGAVTGALERFETFGEARRGRRLTRIRGEPCLGTLVRSAMTLERPRHHWDILGKKNLSGPFSR